jgi:hypothetical protein
MRKELASPYPALTAMDGGNADSAGARVYLPEGEGNKGENLL